MRAMMVEAEWAPRDGYVLSPREERQRVAFNGNMVWRQPTFKVVDLPRPKVSADEVLIRVRACGICGSDVHLYERDADGYMVYPGLIRTPVVTGHEFSGVIEEVGADVTDLARGDAVCAEEIAWCGTCDTCRAGQFNYCRRLDELGFTFNGGHAEFLTIRARACWPIKSLIERYGSECGFQAAALVEPTSVTYLGMFVQAGFKPGATVAVVGGGPIGLAAVGLARTAGAGRVIAFEPSATRRELCSRLGADAVYDPRALSADGMARAALDETAGRGIDLWVEASAAPGVLEAATQALAPNATIALLGLGPHVARLEAFRLVRSGSRLVGSLGHSGSGAFPNVIRLMATGRLDMSQIVTDRVALDDAVGCLEKLHHREAGKYMVIF